VTFVVFLAEKLGLDTFVLINSVLRQCMYLSEWHGQSSREISVRFVSFLPEKLGLDTLVLINSVFNIMYI
jgi:hypothetical protein